MVISIGCIQKEPIRPIRPLSLVASSTFFEVFYGRLWYVCVCVPNVGRVSLCVCEREREKRLSRTENPQPAQWNRPITIWNDAHWQTTSKTLNVPKMRKDMDERNCQW